MSESVDRAETPRTSRIEVTLFSVPIEGIVEVRFLGAIDGILTHWCKGSGTSKGHAIACPGLEHCDRKVHNTGIVWKGYAPAEYFTSAPVPSWVPTVVEVTERLFDLIGPENPRGQHWRLCRIKGRLTRREVSGEFVDRVDWRNLRSDIDVHPVISRVYRSLEIQWGQRPPFARRQILEVAETPRAEMPRIFVESSATNDKPRKSFRELREEMERKQTSGGNQS